MDSKFVLSAADFAIARKRLLQMHFESGVGHIGGNLSALDALLIVFHEHLRVLERAGYSGISVNTFVNTYSLRYWTRLTPLPRGVKQTLSRLMAATGMDKVRTGFNVGNLIAAGFKDA